MTIHKLVADGNRVACNRRTFRDDTPHAVRFRAYLTAFMSRHPEATPCKRCWPGE